MYRLCFTFLLSLISLVCFSQDKKGLDTTKKVVFSEIVKVDSTNRFDLYLKAVKWVERQKFEVVEEDQLGGKIVAKNSFIVYTDKGVLAKPNGDFTHDIIIELKDGRYRYTFDNFIYRQYKQDRTLKYVPVKGQKPIEDSKAAGWKKQWGKNKIQVTNKINDYISSLNSALKYVPPVKIVEKAKDDW